MTYKEYLQKLMVVAIAKSNALIDVVREEGQSESQRYRHAYNEWETAEDEYVACLELLESGQVSSAEHISHLKNIVSAQIKKVAASLIF